MSIQTARIRDAVEPVSSHPAVVDARVIDLTYLDVPRALEIVLRPGIDRVPPNVLLTLGQYDCGLQSVHRQGDHRIVTVY